MVETMNEAGHKKLGRPRKDKSSLEVMVKNAYDKAAHRVPLTYEECALVMWNPEKEDKPLSAMAIYKIEQRAKAKILAKLQELGISKFSDVFGESPFREVGKVAETPEW